MLFAIEKSDTSNQNRERCFFTCEENDTSNQKPQRCVSFAGAALFRRKKNRGNCIGIVLNISLSMKKIEKT